MLPSRLNALLPGFPFEPISAVLPKQTAEVRARVSVRARVRARVRVRVWVRVVAGFPVRAARFCVAQADRGGD